MRSRWGQPAERLHDPVVWSTAVHTAKTALAAIVAWLLAIEVFELPQSFLAPWAALLVVHATVYRTMSRGVQQVVATVIAVSLASVLGHVVASLNLALVLVIVLGLAIGLLPWLRPESVTVAATGLLVLTTGVHDEFLLVTRLVDTALGVATGLLVNLLVWPPLADRAAARVIEDIRDSIGDLLSGIAKVIETTCHADDIEDWLERTREIDGQINQAWSLVRQARESARLNPRSGARALRDPQVWQRTLHRMEQAVAEIRSMAGTFQSGTAPREQWDQRFATAWIRQLAATGAAVSATDDGAIAEVRHELSLLARQLSDDESWSPVWPFFGALIVNLRNILDSMSDVAVAADQI